MYLGTPTVATNWSANAEFMGAFKESPSPKHEDIEAYDAPDCCCPVRGEFVTIPTQIGPYEKGNRWMDADVAQATEYLKKLYEDKDYYNRLSENGRTQIRRVLSYERAGKIVKEKLLEKV